ncbi:MAG: MFS transporter [Planctomycetes bacterium]|nr:MFS transporter [Planctomycetota bacterium]
MSPRTRPHWARSVEQYFPALAIRNYRLYMGARAFAMVGNWIAFPVIPWLVYDITGSNSALGTIKFVSLIPVTLLVVVGGVLADRYTKRKLVFATQASLMLGSLMFGVLAATGHLNLAAIYVLAFLTGIGRAFDIPARQSFIVEVAGRRALGNAIALRSATFNLARIISPRIGGLIFLVLAATGCFVVKALTFIPILVVLFFIRPQYAPHAGTTADGSRARLGEGLRYAFSKRGICVILLLWGVMSLFASAYNTLLPAFTRQVYGKNVGEYTLLVSAQGIGALAAALFLVGVAHRRRPQRGNIPDSPGRRDAGLVPPQVSAVAGALIICTALAGLALTGTYFVAILLVALFGFGWTSFAVSSDVLLQRLVDDRFRGRVMGLRTLAFGGMAPIGALLAGQIASVVSIRWTVALSATLVAAGCAVFCPVILRVRLAADLPAAGEASESKSEDEQ